jgi:hypothetical protein
VVDVERRLEPVVGLELLLDVEGGGELVGVEQSDLRGPLRSRGGGRARAVGVELLRPDPVLQPERGQGRGVVALDGRPVQRRGAGLLALAMGE